MFLYRQDYARTDTIAELQHREFLAPNDDVARADATDFAENGLNDKHQKFIHPSFIVYRIGEVITQ